MVWIDTLVSLLFPSLRCAADLNYGAENTGSGIQLARDGLRHFPEVFPRAVNCRYIRGLRSQASGICDG